MGSTKIETPAPPAAPTSRDTMKDYIDNYPALFQLMQQYAPQEAAMNVGLTQQYAQPMGEALKTAQEAMYPQETALNQQMMGQVQEGLGSGLPDWAKQSYMDTMRAQLGENALSGVGADYMSRGMLDLQKGWQDYYRNLGLSITGRQPVYQAAPTGYTNQLGGYTPQTEFGFAQGNYGNYANTFSNMYNTNAQVAAQGNPYFNALAGMAGQAAGGYFFGKSSNKYKRNIVLWE